VKLHKLTQATHVGLRTEQEDRVFILPIKRGLCIGIFDGHSGSECAQKCVEVLPEIITSLSKVPTAGLLASAISLLHKETQSLTSGSTASLAFIPEAADRVYVAILGDSPIVVRRADHSIWVSPEHNVGSNEAERNAAVERGGVIYLGHLQVPDRMDIGIRMSRALGDAELAPVVNRTPECFVHDLGEGSFVLVASDGALDPAHLHTEEHVTTLVKMIDEKCSAQDIVDRSRKEGDNVSAILVQMREQQ